MSAGQHSETIVGGLGGALQMMGKLGISIATSDVPVRRRGSRRSKKQNKKTKQLRAERGKLLPSVEVFDRARVIRKPPAAQSFATRINNAVSLGYRRLLGAFGVQQANKEEPCQDPPMEEVTLPQRYRPDNLTSLCEATGFSSSEIKRIYRGFKTECPTGLVTEEVFYSIFSKFFPLVGDAYNANASSYSHYVFSTLDLDDTGVITFEEFALGLSTLLNGSLEEKLRWTFHLYDLNGDGVITKDEMEDVTASVYQLMGVNTEWEGRNQIIKKVDTVFKKLDREGYGEVTLEHFIQTCTRDPVLRQSLVAWHGESTLD